MIEIRRILCPVDFSDYSRLALDHAIAIARWYGSTVTVLHVFSPVHVGASAPGPVVIEPMVLTPIDRDRLKRVLCPVDFFDSSLRALDYALSMVQEAGGHLTVLHVVSHEFERTADMASIVYDARKTIGDFLKEREEALRQRLQGAVTGAAKSCSVESLMTHGKPWREVLRVASERQSDLIVMGVHGRGVADLLFFGSTTQHVVREAECPVLTIRRG